MSLFQYAACIEGWNAAQAGETRIEAPTDEEFAAAKEAYGDA